MPFFNSRYGPILINRKVVAARASDPPDNAQARRRGGSRRPASDRVRMKRGDQEFIGWSLNRSRGGVRIVLEDSIELHAEYSVVFGDDEANPRPCRVAWIQEEAGGQIAGLQFLDVVGTVPPFDPPDRDT